MSFTKKRIYLSGAMSGHEHWNYPAFHAAAQKWRDAGWAVQNPAELGGEDLSSPWSDFMRVDLLVIMFCSDAIGLLPGWEHSKGARVELVVARVFNKVVYCAEAMKIITSKISISISGCEALEI